MGQEIEHKFLVDAKQLGSVIEDPGVRLTQGYLSERPVVRVRLAEGADATAQAWITIKGPGLLARAEYEYPVPPHDAREMLALCAHVILKTRRHVYIGGHTWDLDEFHGALQGLWLAEIELPAAGADFERPAWVTDEVTDDARYANVALARATEIPPR
jgi:CYTH domain-containing protein